MFVLYIHLFIFFQCFEEILLINFINSALNEFCYISDVNSSGDSTKMEFLGVGRIFNHPGLGHLSQYVFSTNFKWWG